MSHILSKQIQKLSCSQPGTGEGARRLPAGKHKGSLRRRGPYGMTEGTKVRLREIRKVVCGQEILRSAQDDGWGRGLLFHDPAPRNDACCSRHDVCGST